MKDPQVNIGQYLLKCSVYLAAFITLIISLWIISYIIINGLSALSFEFLFSGSGILPMIVTTVLIVLLTLLISTPIGIFAAIYLNEYSKKGKIVKIVRFCILSLAGIPSIIYGLFGMLFFVIFFNIGFSILSGALTLSIMVLPVIITNTEEDLRVIPNAYREGSIALGASKVRTIFLVILPSAAPGILTGILLSIGRMIGESAAVFMTAGMVSRMPSDLLSSGRTLAVHMYLLAKEGLDFDKAFSTALVLIILVLVINFIATYSAAILSKNRRR